ncbi:MAG: lamin tail domain-containing protein [Acidobacteria bacterium]|nr:lamin tail domain-containing protein [Acidobacteriota bacterium]
MSPAKRELRPVFKITPGARAPRNSVLRRILVNSLCLILLCSTTPQLFAQRRTSIRVPVGEARPAPPASARKSVGGKEKQRASNARARARRQDGASLTGAPIGMQEITVGVPSTGEVGVQKTTDEIMVEQAHAPVIARRPMLVSEREIPNRKSRPQDPDARPLASTPSSLSMSSVGGNLGVTSAPEESSSPSSPQTLSTTFNAVTGPTENGAFPPDTMGAVGPSQFVLFVNGRLRTFNKTTGTADGVINVDPDVFFSSVTTPPPAPLAINFTTDPQIRYDRLSARWIMIIIDVPSANDIGDTPNRLLIAVSDAASAGVISAGTVWTFFFVQQNTVGGGDSGEFLDYPSLGVDANALYVGGDMFDAALGGFNNTSVWVIRKSSILSGGPVVTTAFRDLIGTDGPFEPRGVDNYDPAATEGYFIGASAAAFGRLIMRRIGTPGTTPTISANISITVPSTSFPRSVDHLGDSGGTGATGNLDALDDRLMTAHIRAGRLWTAHAISVLATGVSSGTNAERRDAVRWYELVVPPTTGTPTVNQSGTVFDTAATRATSREFFIPSVMVSGQGHAALGYSTAGTPFRADAATNGRLAGDALGTLGAVNIYTASSTAYNPPSDPGSPRRWGDYSFTSLDPKDDMTMWTVQQFCNSTNTYGAQVVKLLAPPPPAAAVAVPPAVADETASTSVVLTGTPVAGTAYYDPGTDLAAPALPFNHISATVTGGVTVTSITFDSPTQVTLNLSTVGATSGPQNVTITNPDGQQAIYTAAVTVTSAPAPAATAGQVLISEFRFRGAGGASDEFVELYNNTNTDLDISGYTLHALTAAGAQNLRFTVPGALASSTTVIPARGHFLITGSAYSLAAVAASNGALSTGIVDGSGIGFFAGATPTVPTRIDGHGQQRRRFLLHLHDRRHFQHEGLRPRRAGAGEPRLARHQDARTDSGRAARHGGRQYDRPQPRADAAPGMPARQFACHRLRQHEVQPRHDGDQAQVHQQHGRARLTPALPRRQHHDAQQPQSGCRGGRHPSTQ